LAERFSIDQSSRFRGGDPGREFGYNDLPIDMAQVAFSLKPDSLGGPVKSDMGWHILKLVESRKLESRDYDAVRPTIEATLRRRKQQERRSEHLVQMEEQSKIAFSPQSLSLWREKLQQVADTTSLPKDRQPAVATASLSQQERDRVMYTFGEDYSVGVGEFCEALEARSAFERPDPNNDSQLRRFAFQLSLFDILHDEALRRQLDESPIYKERVQNYLESLIAERMRNSVLIRGISVTQSEVRAFYDAHPDSFINPAGYHCREILVHKQEEADRLIAQLRAGASFEELARIHTQRAGMKGNGGDLGWITPTAWPDMYEPASKLKPGEWTGPVVAVDQYSLIQLIESRPATQRTYDEVVTEIFESIQRKRRDSIFVAYIDSMRAAYPVTVREEVLQSGLTGSRGEIDSVKAN
jgi:peptidyl-prolyl cis-trans isomerase C